MIMQQLDLFGRDVLHEVRPHKSGKSVKNPKSTGLGIGVWDLWSPQLDLEKEMALFFLDIRNFTSLAEKHQAASVIHIIKKLFSTFQHIIRVHHGRIIETSGDGFYAAFGFECHVREAVNAAVESGKAIIKTLEQLNSLSFEKNLGQRIDVGIGVHVGMVATGNLYLGSKDHMVIMGYPVNVASRLQAATKALGNNFIVSAEVFKMLRNPALTNPPVKVILKGMKDAVAVHLIGKAYTDH
jgi:adenylate cyclase